MSQNLESTLSLSIKIKGLFKVKSIQGRIGKVIEEPGLCNNYRYFFNSELERNQKFYSYESLRTINTNA